MPFDEDMEIVEKLLGEMKNKFGVANPVGKSALTAETDTWQNEVRKTLANSENPLAIARVIADERFYREFGKVIAEKAQTMRLVNMKCFDFNAYISKKLTDLHFEGSIHKGLIGYSTTTGHEFLILYAGHHEYERILDCWSAFQTGKNAICKKEDYAELLPSSKVIQAALENGIKQGLQLKPGVG